MNVVVGGDQFSRGAGGFLGRGDHHSDHVTGKGGGASDGDHDRPVLVDDADPELAGDIGSGQDRDHLIVGFSFGGVDRGDGGSSVIGEHQGGVEQARHPDVIDIAPVTKGEALGFVLMSLAANFTGEDRLGGCGLGNRFDGIENLDIAGAATEVGPQVGFHRLAGEVGALGIDLGLGSHHDAGNAVAALGAAMGGKGVGEGFPLSGVNPFEGGHLGSSDLFQRLGA